jgi:DNA-binding response OmpR family regulator
VTAPTIDEFDVLRFADRWVALGPVEARLARELVASPGRVVPRGTLEAAGWGDAPVRPNTTDRQMNRLRNHLATVGLTLHTVRGHGYMLEPAAALTSA